MYVANAHKQTKRSSKDDSPTTAGVGKLPSQTITNKSELKVLGDRMGWTVRPLTENEIRGSMSAQESIWHETWNSDNYKAAFTVEENKRDNKANMAGWNNKRMWSGKATEDESQKAFAAGDRFASSYSQFIRSESNGLAIVEYMADHNLDATQVQSYIEAFDFLAPQGRLVLSPKAAGIGPEETLTGGALKLYPRLHLLTQPNRALKPEDKLSANEWFAQHAELHDTRVPDRIIQGWNKVMQTFVAGHPEFIDSAKSREKLFAALKSKNMNVTPQAIDEVFHDLAKNGEVQIDNSKTVQGQAVRLVDLGGRR
jgi:hypothetical protein